ncbi:MAG: type II toxin-antitoxin system HicA family toxin [Methylocystis sp.]|nr:type II toxin-antitoxin system HicA family toxin [Methylocystis sp.]
MSRRLDAMRRNPAGDWRIEDVEALCREFAILCEPARGGGSHYKIGHPRLAQKLTIPFKRPIKAVYIRKLIAFVDAVRTLP